MTTPEFGSDFFNDLGNAARRNPVSAALIGMGVIWLFSGGARGAMNNVGRSGFNRFSEAVRDTASATQEGTAKVMEAAREKGRNGIESATRVASGYVDVGAVDLFETAHANLSELFDAQPLALGAIGIAIGAGLAAALPGTDLEGSYLGDASEALKKKVTAATGEQIGKVSAVAGDVIETVIDEARKQGLTVEDAKAAADTLTTKVGRVVNAAKMSSQKSINDTTTIDRSKT